MIRMLTLIPVLAIFAMAAPAGADDDDRPPRNALPLSQIIAMVEQQRPVAYFKEVEWDDDDDDHWEIEYVSPQGREVEIKVHAVTGRIRGD